MAALTGINSDPSASLDIRGRKADTSDNGV
jgi:hypothetical protein